LKNTASLGWGGGSSDDVKYSEIGKGEDKGRKKKEKMKMNKTVKCKKRQK
jgi:hypothetical protein